MTWAQKNDPAKGLYTFDYCLNILLAQPFVCVWALSILVFFIIEVDLWLAHNFNSKHSYGVYTKRVLLSLTNIVVLFKTTKNKSQFLKAFYKFYI